MWVFWWVCQGEGVEEGLQRKGRRRKKEGSRRSHVVGVE